ncbi:ribulokinase [Peptococcaceae bacterium CEB3]|nr:ribulokinase [Peptococcaceae bacterium CEB3]
MPYSIGVDYGTESGRVLLLELTTGREIAVSAVPYACGVINKVLPDSGVELASDWALQDPRDYVRVLTEGIPMVMSDAQVEADEVIGIGIDFTSCTVMPVDQHGTPLCFFPEWRSHPHAWPKLWKHHAAKDQANRMTGLALARQEEFLPRYGGRISSEWYFPKLLQVLEEDRDVYTACQAYTEAADWIVWYLTGNERRNNCTAGYKALWLDEIGLPARDFFTSLHPEFGDAREKLGTTFYPLGTKAGTLRPEIALQLGLPTRVAVSVGNIDAHVSVPALAVTQPGSLVIVAGTSICHLTLTEEEILLPGITGVVKDGIIPGFYGYEAGQAAVGDMYAWFVKQALSSDYHNLALESRRNVYDYLEGLAASLAPGESGLLALDWWNGNRSILGDADLSGTIIGLTLSTRPEDIYRALLESTAMGTRRIVENFAQHGIEVNELVICGGIAQRSPLLMQIYADVCALPVVVRNSSEIPARGAALYGAVAAGSGMGGYDSIGEAGNALAPEVLHTYLPQSGGKKVYEEIYQLYRTAYDYFGSEHASLMHELKGLRTSVRSTARDSGAVIEQVQTICPPKRLPVT